MRSWQAAYKGLLPQDYLDRLDAKQRAARYDFVNTDPSKPKTFLAVNEKSIVGFVTISPATKSDQADHGELNALYVDPDHWRVGIGSNLLMHAEQQLAARGYQQAVLWVLRGNVTAGQFYRANGWDTDGHSRCATVWNLAIDEIRYQRALRKE